jgi:4-amino-4-deoxy-L-arabinose transferase-like glycosyltransferase
MFVNFSIIKPDKKLIRFLMALIGFLLLVAGQYQLSRSNPLSIPPTLFGQWLNHTLRFDIINIDNIIFGLPLVLLGVFLFVFSLHSLILLPIENEFKKNIFRFIHTPFTWSGIICASVIFCSTVWSLATHEYSTFNVISWIASLLIFVYIFLSWDRKRGVKLSIPVARKDILWILGLTTLGILIGTYRLQGLPDSLIGDEGSFWTVARDIATGSFKPPIFANGVYTFPILSSYIQACILKTFGISLWGWRLSSVLAGVATLPPLYLLAREMFNRTVAITVSFALIFNPYFMAFSRIGYISIQALFFTTLGFYWLYLGLKHDSLLNLFLAGIAAGFGFYTFFGARFTFVIGIAYIALLWLGRQIKFRQAVYALIIFGFGVLLIAGPYIVYGLSHDPSSLGYKIFESVFFNTFNGKIFFPDKELFAIAPPFQINGSTLFFNPKIYLILFIRGLARTQLAFQMPGLITEHYIASSLTGTVGSIFFILGLVMSLWRFKQPRNILLLLWYFGIMLGLSTLNTVPPRHTHMVSIIPVLALLTGIGIYSFANAVATLHKKILNIRKFLLSGLVIFLVLGGLIDFFISMPKKYRPQSDQIMSWAVLYAKDESIFYIYSRPDERNFQPYISTEFRPTISFRTVSIDDVNQDFFKSIGEKKSIIFYDPSLVGSVTLALQPAGDYYDQKIFSNPEGIPILVALMNTPFIFVRDQSLVTIIEDTFSHPSLMILIFSLLAVLFVTTFFPASWMHAISMKYIFLSKWVDGPENIPIGAVDWEVIEDPEQTQEIIPSEPPEWVGQIFPSLREIKSDHIRIEIKQFVSDVGKDFYFRFHFPKLRFWEGKSHPNFKLSFPPLQIPNIALIVTTMILALVAQLFIIERSILAGIIAYISSAAVFILWVRLHSKWINVFEDQLRISRHLEMFLMGILLLVAGFFRFYDLGHRIFGLGIEETKWTIQSWFSTIVHVDLGEYAASHFMYMPADFWIRSFFLRIFGTNFISTRIESALFSLISIFFLYLLIRRVTTSPSTALLATLIYSFAAIELVASHQGTQYALMELLVIGSLYFLILGLVEQKWWQYQTVGFILSLGMLTHEAFFPVPIGIIALMVSLSVYSIIKHHNSPRKGVTALFLVIWPIVMTYFTFTRYYLEIHPGNIVGIFTHPEDKISNLIDLLKYSWAYYGNMLQAIFHGSTNQDSVLSWGGNYINPILLPFTVVGFVYNILNFRRPILILLPLSYLFLVLTSVLAGTTSPIILYMGLPILISWGAMGLCILLSAIRTICTSFKIRIAFPAFMLIVIAIMSYDVHVFTTGINDSADSQKRRELSDLAIQSTISVPMTVFPYMQNRDDTVFVESDLILFSVGGSHHAGLEAKKFIDFVRFDDLLPFLWHSRNLDKIDIIFDKTTSNLQFDRLSVLQIILHCYPDTGLSFSGIYFDVYRIDRQNLQHPLCYGGVSPTIMNPSEGAILKSNYPITFSWNSNGVESESYAVTIERKLAGTYWIEAEGNFEGPSWEVSSEFVFDFSGTGFILDGWHAGEAVGSFLVPENGQYNIWIRSYKRRINDQHNFINIQGKYIGFAGESNPLSEWVWENLGMFSLSKGDFPMSLSRTYGVDEEYSVFIDAIVITKDLSNSPDRIRVWKPEVNTGEITSTASQYTLREILSPGEYRWRVQIFNDQFLIDSKGSRGLESPFTEFSIVR